MNTKSKIIPFLILTVGFLFGASVLSTLAAFQTPPSSPPACDPASYPGCNVPLNVGNEPQEKGGVLTLNAKDASGNPLSYGLTVLNGIQIIDGNEGVGKVLVSDADGVAGWADPVGATVPGFSLTAEVKLTTSGTDKTKTLTPADANHPGCFLTNTSMVGNNEFSSGACTITNTGGNWVLNADKNDNDDVVCAARCIQYN